MAHPTYTCRVAVSMHGIRLARELEPDHCEICLTEIPYGQQHCPQCAGELRLSHALHTLIRAKEIANQEITLLSPSE